MTPDLDLLRDYVDNRAESAFAELVNRHANWVHAIARRKVRDDQLALDVSQAVFIVLSRKAPQLLAKRWNMRLTGWLYHVVRLTAANALRELSRRRRYEQEAAAQRATETQADDSIDWESLLPMVDASLADLGASDREAVLLRFYRQQSFTDVAQALGISEDAARKRVARALDRLRGLLRRRGQTSLASAALAAGLLAGAAPSSAAAIMIGAVGSTTSSLLAKGVMHALAWKQAAVAASVAIVVAVVGGGSALMLKADGATPKVQTPNPQLLLTAQPIAEVAPAAASQPVIDPVAQKHMDDVYTAFLSLKSASWKMDYQQPEEPWHFWGPKREATVAFKRPNLCVVHSKDIRGEFWSMSDGREMAWLKTAFQSQPGRGGWSVPDPKARTYFRMSAPPGDDAVKRVMEEGASDGYDFLRWMCARVTPMELDTANRERLVSLVQGPAGELDGVATDCVVATYRREYPDAKYDGTFVMTYEIGRDDHFVRRMTQTFTRTDGQAPPRTTVGTYTQVRLNTDLPDEMFALAPPAGLAPETPRWGYNPKVVAVGAVPPPIETVDLAGQKISLNDLRGKVVLINFVSPVSELQPPERSPRVRVEPSALPGLYQKYHEQGLEILTIGTNRPKEKGYREEELKRIAESLELPWRVAYDAGRLVADAYGIDRSTTLVIGRDGKIVMLDDEALLEVRLQRALAELVPAADVSK
jgi:RNA polymerase sigma factor (sigma-70 family)